MDPFEWIKQRWKGKAAPSTYIQIDPGHVDLGDGRPQDATPLVSGEHYFRLWLVAMSLENDRKWFKEWMPAAYSLIKFKFGDQDITVSHLAGQTMLKGLDESAVGRRVGLNYPMTTLAPFNGGSIEMETGLVAVPGKDDIATLLNVLGRFSQILVVPQLSAVLSTAKAVAEGLAEFVGATDAKPVLRFHNTFTTGETAGANRLRSGYFLVSSATDGTIDPAQLWIVQDRPFYGATAATAKPLVDSHYLLFRIEAPTTRDDWESLTSIDQPFQQALLLLQQAAMEADPDLQRKLMLAAERQRDAAKFAAMRAPELTRIGGRNQVIDGLLRSFDQAKRAMGQGLAESGLVKTLTAAVRRGMSAQQAIALGEVPVTDWLLTDKPLSPPAASAPPSEAAPTTTTRGGRRRGGTPQPPPPPPQGGTRRRGIEHPQQEQMQQQMQQSQPPPPAPPAEIHVDKTPHMDLAPGGALKPGQTFKAIVSVDDLPARPGEQSEGLGLTVPASTKAIDLEVWITGTPHFEFVGPRIKPIVIDLPSGTAAPVEFDVKVRDDVAASGSGSLAANFSYKCRPSGRVAVQVEIVVDGQPTEAVATVSAGAQPRPSIHVEGSPKAADLTIEVLDPGNTSQHFECRVWSPHLGNGIRSAPFPWNLNRNASELVKAFMAEFVKPDIGDDERLLNLKGAGRELWQSTPKPLQDAFWSLVDLDKLETIQIVSEEPFIPWELMIPRRGQQTLQPLGSAYVVGRWLPRDYIAAPQSLALSRSVVIAPAYGPPPEPPVLEFANDEMQLVLATVDGEAVTPATSAAVRQKLLAGKASLVHFVCHGVDSTSFGAQVIELKGGQLTSLQIAGMDDLPQAFANRPLVFLNACEIGRLSPALVGVGGFAKAFLDAGAGGVIAPLWSVRDSVAHEIAETFYGHLKGGKQMRPAEVLRDVRRNAYITTATTQGEDSYAAYCFYGDPEAIAFIPSEGGRP